MNAVSRKVKPNGSRQAMQAIGRATRSSVAVVTASASQGTDRIMLGVRSRPSMRKSTIWASQPIASKNCSTALADRFSSADNDASQINGDEPARANALRSPEQ
jgi:hypothetical protein